MAGCVTGSPAPPTSPTTVAPDDVVDVVLLEEQSNVCPLPVPWTWRTRRRRDPGMGPLSTATSGEAPGIDTEACHVLYGTTAASWRKLLAPLLSGGYRGLPAVPKPWGVFDLLLSMG